MARSKNTECNRDLDSLTSPPPPRMVVTKRLISEYTGWGQITSAWNTGHYWTCITKRKHEAVSVMRAGKGNHSTSRKLDPVPVCESWHGMGLNRDHHGGKSAVKNHCVPGICPSSRILNINKCLGNWICFNPQRRGGRHLLCRDPQLSWRRKQIQSPKCCVF
jgi:hypothetical protein